LRFIQSESPKTGLIRSQRIGKHKGIASVVLRSRDTVTVPEPVELLGVNGKDVEAARDRVICQIGVPQLTHSFAAN
jgi:hypothetical protein